MHHRQHLQPPRYLFEVRRAMPVRQLPGDQCEVVRLREDTPTELDVRRRHKEHGMTWIDSRPTSS